jgi:cellulose synthase/poly-beta-1,6-N-acetylglucosamine synthase-like glycosyltransferase
MQFRVLAKRGKKIMDRIYESVLILALSLYFLVGSLQLATAIRIKREANKIRFPKKDPFVSVIIPIRGISSTTWQNLKSVCVQNYPKYEVLFVAEEKGHPAFSKACFLSRKYPHVKLRISGPHDPKKCIAKCHNLVFGVSRAKGDVFLFGDSDVTYSKNWIRKMTEPLGEVVKGKLVHATTAPFFMEPIGIKGKIIALPVSIVTFTSSFTRYSQRFPSYASGASIAVSREIFEKLQISNIWKRSFNDDLVFANRIISSGHHIYNQHALLNHPNEAFLDWQQTINKLIRWVVTVSTFRHERLIAKTPVMLAKNLQFQVTLILSIILYFLGFSGIFILTILAAGYFYSVFYRLAVGVIIEEKDMLPYYILAPLMSLALIVFHATVRTRYRGFSWEGESYDIQ